MHTDVDVTATQWHSQAFLSTSPSQFAIVSGSCLGGGPNRRWDYFEEDPQSLDFYLFLLSMPVGLGLLGRCTVAIPAVRT